MKGSWLGFFGIVAMTASFVVLPDDSPVKQASTWQQLASPGGLSRAHASLAEDCAACHEAVEGATRQRCVLCHANSEALLSRQPTAFHASISSCVECHAEHLGPAPSTMDHDALASIGLDELRAASDDSGLHAWLLRGIEAPEHPAHPAGADGPSARERMLDCFACHGRQDRHFGLLGRDCVACHATANWGLATFRHPSPRSHDCAQCHQAPPSHYMGHFKMVSAKVARKPEALVRQCFECHRTTAWTDIPGIGHYKHH